MFRFSDGAVNTCITKSGPDMPAREKYLSGFHYIVFKLGYLNAQSDALLA
jgi:hypothetical protein